MSIYEHYDREPVRLTIADSGLFRNFAALTPTQTEILHFANQYGDLGAAKSWNFAGWEYEVRVLKFFVDLHDALTKGGRRQIIAEHFVADKSGKIRFPFMDGSLGFGKSLPDISASNWQPGESDYFFRGSMTDAAREFLNRVLNFRLREFQGVLYLDRAGKTHELTLRPTNLISTLWLQFSLAVVENKEFRQCESCGRTFELSPEINRTSRYYCSNACRVKAYRRRKAKARRLHAKGKTVRQIAAELESTSDTVKAWLKSIDDRKKGPQR